MLRATTALLSKGKTSSNDGSGNPYYLPTPVSIVFTYTCEQTTKEYQMLEENSSLKERGHDGQSNT